MINLFHALCFAEKLPWYLVPVKYIMWGLIEIVLFFHRIFMMGQSWFRQGQEYGNGQSGNVEAVRVGEAQPKTQKK